MKKNLFIMLSIVILLSGCAKNGNNNNNNNSAELEAEKEKIKTFIKEASDNDLSEWSYSDDKIKISDDLSVEITANNVDDQYVCAIFTKVFVYNNIKKDGNPFTNNKITIACNNNNSPNYKVVVNDISKVNETDFFSNATVYDKDNNNIEMSDQLIEEDYKSKSKNTPYKEFYRNYDDYEGTRIHFTGKVFQVQNASDDYYLLMMNVTKDSWGYYSDDVAVLFEKRLLKGRPAEDDIIEVYGEFLPIYSYETVMGDTREIPLVHARFLSFK